MGQILKHEDESVKVLHKILTQIQNEKGMSVVAIGSDHGGKFENEIFPAFCKNYSINHNFFYSKDTTTKW